LREVRKKSPVPIYGAALVWILYCLFLPLYALHHFLILIVLAAASYFILHKFFPDAVEYIEQPVTTGNPEVDALLEEGRKAVGEMRRIKLSPNALPIAGRIDRLITVTENIFKDVANDPGDAPQVRRFANYYLPTTVKLLREYEKMRSAGVSGKNIDETLAKIENILDTTAIAYEKQLDALFSDQALDIDTDITVLESMLKREGLSGKDFHTD